MKNERNNKAGESGFSIVELLIAVTVMMVVLGLVGSCCLNRSASVSAKAAAPTRLLQRKPR
jgi:Tfp pilus assembly protein PilW